MMFLIHDSPETFQSTPLMRGETRFPMIRAICVEISIHSPHARGDKNKYEFEKFIVISIHSPHARGDPRFRLMVS